MKMTQSLKESDSSKYTKGLEESAVLSDNLSKIWYEVRAIMNNLLNFS